MVWNDAGYTGYNYIESNAAMHAEPEDIKNALFICGTTNLCLLRRLDYVAIP